jgi:hypothetical protein
MAGLSHKECASATNFEHVDVYENTTEEKQT